MVFSGRVVGPPGKQALWIRAELKGKSLRFQSLGHVDKTLQSVDIKMTGIPVKQVRNCKN
jgi:hypothetical protein